MQNVSSTEGVWSGVGAPLLSQSPESLGISVRRQPGASKAGSGPEMEFTQDKWKVQCLETNTNC